MDCPRTPSWATAAATSQSGGGASRKGCGAGRSSASARRTRSSSASPSAISTRARAPATRGRSPGRGRASAARFHWATDASPANHVSLRSVGWDNFVIIDKAHGKTLAELDWRAAPTMLHEQAIYQHDGEQYQVEQLDHENHKAYVRKVVPD